MAWTTRIVHVHHETAEVLQAKDLHKYRQVKQSQIITRINDTHTERIIIREYRDSEQKQLW